MHFSTAVAGCLILAAALVSGDDTPNYGQQQWSTDTHMIPPRHTTAFPCQAKRGHRQLLLGGVTDLKKTRSGDYNSSSMVLSSLDLNLLRSGWYSSAAGLDFELDGQGSCTTDEDGNLYVTNTGGSAPTGDLYHRDFFVYQLYNASKTTTAGWLGITRTSRQRARSALMATSDCLFLFGGVDFLAPTLTPLFHVERYSFSSNNWEPQYAKFPTQDPKDPQGYCNCVPFFPHEHVVLVCSQCSTRAQGFDTNRISFLRLDINHKVISHIGPREPITVPFKTFLHYEATMIGHYIVLLVSSTDKNTEVYYFDLVSEQLHQYDSNPMMSLGDEPGSAYGGGFFVREFTAFYVGGIQYGSTMGNEPQLSNQVSTLPVIPTTRVTKKTKGTSYTGDFLTFAPANKSVCTDSVRLRISSTVDCRGKIPGVREDVGCLSNDDYLFTWGAPPHPIDAGYICISYGTCSVEPSKRLGCPIPAALSGLVNWTFTQCLMAGCCYDKSAARPEESCFQYGTANSTDAKYFTNVNAESIQILVKPGPKVEAPPFFQTTPGVITICASAGIIVIAAVIVIAYFQRKKPQMEHPLENNAKYRLLTKVGEGGFGTVFLVEQKGTPATKEKYAMKYIACQTEEDRGYAMKEFELIRSAQGHPNMIKLIDMFMSWADDDEEPTGATGVINTADETRMKNGGKALSKKETAPDGSPLRGPMADERKALLNLAPKYVCIVMEFYPDGDLSGHIRKHARSGMQEGFLMKVLCRQCCELLQHLHARQPPIVHRDMKPENILLAENLGKIVVTDFGLASEQEKSYMSTRAGSLHYVAPECWKRHYTCAVDMWGLGCIMYAAATGRVTADTARVMFSDARDRGFEKDIRYDLRRFSIQFQDIVIGFLTVDPLKRMTPSKALEVLDSM